MEVNGRCAHWGDNNWIWDENLMSKYKGSSNDRGMEGLVSDCKYLCHMNKYCTFLTYNPYDPIINNNTNNTDGNYWCYLWSGQSCAVTEYKGYQTIKKIVECRQTRKFLLMPVLLGNKSRWLNFKKLINQVF